MISLNVSMDIDQMEENMINMTKNVLFKSMSKMHELAQMFADRSVYTGLLRAGIKLFPDYSGAESYLLRSSRNYSEAIEYGTKPHFVSASDLKGWAKKKLGDEKLAYAVSKSIAKKGTQAQPFMRPAFDEVRNFWIKVFWVEELANQIKP